MNVSIIEVLYNVLKYVGLLFYSIFELNRGE